MTQRKEECPEARRLPLIDSLLPDVVYAVRSLRKTPAFTVIALLSLAIGIGANTTVFTFVNAILLRSLPYPGSERLVILNEQSIESAAPLSVHPVNFVEWRARARSFDSLVLVQAPPLNINGNDGPEQTVRLLTTPELFRVFGVSPILGRGFTEEETRPGAHNVVILGHGFWQRRFGADPGVIGRQLAVPDGALTIVGVAPVDFRIGSIEPDVFTPMIIDPANPAQTGSRAFECYGRLASSVSLTAAQAEMTAIAATLRQQHQIDRGMSVLVSSLHDFLVREARPGLRVLMAVVATVLLIACVNLAGLLMARGIQRRGEFAVRAALGASRARLLRQLVIEGLVLSLLGGAAGVVIALWASPLLSGLAGGALPSLTSTPIGVDAVCLVFTFATCVTTTMAFALVPAITASHIDPQMALRDRSGGASMDRRHHQLRSGLVVAEVALAVVLLIGAGLLVRTLAGLVRVNLGFQPSGTVTMGLFLGVRPPEARIGVVDRILDRVDSLPGVKGAGTIQFLPLRGATCGTGFWLEEQAGARDPARALPTECALVSRGYFAAMSIPVLEGRAFTRDDRVSSPRVVIVSHAFARRYFPSGAIGRRVLVQGSNQALAEIVGVVGDIRHNGLTSDAAPTAYLLHAQTPGYITNLVVRTSGEPLSYVGAIRRAIHDADPSQAVAGARLLDQDVAEALSRPRLYAVMVSCFALIAVALATIGVYGVSAYVVTQRTREIGIRLALGAARERVFFDVLRYGSGLIAIGLIVGVVAAISVRQVLSKLVFGVTTGNPSTYVLAVLAFFAVALLATMIPARRATLIEPIQALRCE